MIERVVILGVFLGLSFLAYTAFRRGQVRHAARVAPGDPLLATLRPGIPAILYFTTPTCVPCKTQQRPALEQLVSQIGDQVQVIEVNALEQTEAADRWGVLSVPTLFILDRQGQPAQINHGVTTAHTLMRQLQGLN